VLGRIVCSVLCMVIFLATRERCPSHTHRWLEHCRCAGRVRSRRDGCSNSFLSDVARMTLNNGRVSLLAVLVVMVGSGSFPAVAWSCSCTEKQTLPPPRCERGELSATRSYYSQAYVACLILTMSVCFACVVVCFCYNVFVSWAML